MTTRKTGKSRKSSGNSIVMLAVFSLAAANLFAAWRIFQLAQLLEIPLIGSLHGGPEQLAILLLVNTGAVLWLLALKYG